MSPDIFDRLRDAPLPAPPPAQQFDKEVHQRLNQRLVVGQVADLAFKAFPYAALQFGRALGGLLAFTMTGRMEGEERKRK